LRFLRPAGAGCLRFHQHPVQFIRPGQHPHGSLRISGPPGPMRVDIRPSRHAPH
jgi:hypothetical protein